MKHGINREYAWSATSKVWRAHDLREAVVQVGDAVKLSAIQRMYDVINTHILLEKETGTTLGAQATAAAWKENVRLAASSEEVKKSFVDACFTVWRRAASNPVIFMIMESLDTDFFPSPLDSIYKTDTIVKRASTEENIRWCLAGIKDLMEFHGAAASDFAERKLSGRGEPGGKGILDLLLAKRDMALAIIQHCTVEGYDPALITMLQEWAQAHNVYREDVEKGQHVKISTMPQSAQGISSLFEEI